jgi:hypothetical protein
VVRISTRLGGHGEDLAGGHEAVQQRHPDVHQDDVGLPGPGQVHGLDAVGRFPDDIDAGLAGQNHPESGPDQPLVVSDQHGDRLGFVHNPS